MGTDVVRIKEVMKMKRGIFLVISFLLLLGLVLAGCGDGVGYGTGGQIAVWPKAEFAALGNGLSRMICGLNWTDVDYAGTVSFQIPAWMVTEWGTW